MNQKFLQMGQKTIRDLEWDSYGCQPMKGIVGNETALRRESTDTRVSTGRSEGGN